MAKPLSVEFHGEVFALDLQKVDRTKLYGYVESEVLDENGKRCEIGTLTGDGHSIVGKGGTALAYLSPDGLWRKKTELKPGARVVTLTYHFADWKPVHQAESICVYQI